MWNRGRELNRWYSSDNMENHESHDHIGNIKTN